MKNTTERPVLAQSLNNCPTCDKRITDSDPEGCEVATGQRYCLDHLPREADPDLYDEWRYFCQREKAKAMALPAPRVPVR